MPQYCTLARVLRPSRCYHRLIHLPLPLLLPLRTHPFFCPNRICTSSTSSSSSCILIRMGPPICIRESPYAAPLHLPSHTFTESTMNDSAEHGRPCTQLPHAVRVCTQQRWRTCLSTLLLSFISSKAQPYPCLSTSKSCATLDNPKSAGVSAPITRMKVPQVLPPSVLRVLVPYLKRTVLSSQ